MVAQTFPGFDNLVRLENVAFATHDVKRHRLVQGEIQAAQIPPLCVPGTVLRHEPSGLANEREAVAPTDRIVDFVELLGR